MGNGGNIWQFLGLNINFLDRNFLFSTEIRASSQIIFRFLDTISTGLAADRVYDVRILNKCDVSLRVFIVQIF